MRIFDGFRMVLNGCLPHFGLSGYSGTSVGAPPSWERGGGGEGCLGPFYFNYYFFCFERERKKCKKGILALIVDKWATSARSIAS